MNRLNPLEMNENDYVKASAHPIELMFTIHCTECTTHVQNYCTCDDPEIIRNVKHMSL